MSKMNVAISVLLMLVLVSTGQAAMMAHWEFENNLLDSSGNGNNGTMMGDGAYATGVDGSCLTLDGTGDYVTVPNSVSLQIGTSDFSFSMWIYLDQTLTAAVLVCEQGGIDTYGQTNYHQIVVRPVGGVMTWEWGVRNAVGTDTADRRMIKGVSDLGLTVGAWNHLAVATDRANKVIHMYLNGVEDTTVVYTIYGGDLGWTSDYQMPIASAFNIGCSRTQANFLPGDVDDIQFYSQALSSSAIAYLYSTPGATVIADLIPDGFEDYADNTQLATLWSTTSGTVSLETTEVLAGAKALRVQTAGAGTVTKTMPYTPNFGSQDGKDIVLWYKGLVGNPAGSLTARFKTGSGVVVAQETVSGATQAPNWSELRIERNLGDPNDLKTLELVLSSAATMYFDSISFQPPVEAPETILEWRLDESSGMAAGDSTIYGNSGVLGSWFTGTQWIIDGGNSGDTGDNALSFAGAGILANAEVITAGALTPDISTNNTYSLNVWVKLDSVTAGKTIVLGGVGDVRSDPGTTENMTHRYIVINADTLEPRLLRGWTGTAWQYSDFDGTITLGEWHMLSVVGNGWANTIDLYIDGALTRTITNYTAGVIDASVAALSPDVFFGGEGETPFTAPEGVVDDFSVWKGLLPAQGDAPSILSLWGGWICDTPVEIDFNGDCVTDLSDFAYFAARWLDCGRVPVSFCP